LISAGVVFVSCAGCLGGGYAAFGERFDPGYAARDYEAAKREYIALGLPWTAKDLAPSAPIRPEEDATPILRNIAEQWDDKKFANALTKVQPEDADALARLRPLDVILDTSSVIQKKTRLYVSRDYDLGPDLLMPEYAKWKGAVKTYCFRAQARADAGDREGMIDDLRSALSFGPLLAQEPALIGHFVAVAVDATAYDSARRIAAQHPEWASLISDNVPDHGRFSPQRALRGETYLMIATARNLERYGGLRELVRTSDEFHGSVYEKENSSQMRRDGDPSGRVARSQLAGILRFYSLIERELAQENARLINVSRTGASFVENLTKTRRASSLLLETMSPVYEQAFNVYDRNVTDFRLTRTYLKLVSRKDNLPKSGWVPADKDGWGQPLIYKREGAGFRLYSVGANGKDEGGLTAKEKFKNAKRSGVVSWHQKRSDSDDVAVVYPPFRVSGEPAPLID